jgi:hypothetical protein
VNVFSKVALAGALAAVCGSAMAADSTADLKVIGTIVPPACTPSLSGGGTLDWGDISTASLEQTYPTALPIKTTDLTVTCDADGRVAFTATDNRAGSNTANLTYAYGLGKTDANNGNVKLGYFLLDRVDNASTTTVDGQSADMTRRVKGTTAWEKGSTPQSQVNINSNMETTWTKDSTAATVQPAVGKVFNMRLRVQPHIASGIAVKDAKKLDGNVTLSLVYP